MKKNNLNFGMFALVLMAIILLNSCSNFSISSRRYNKGYHFEWVSKTSKYTEKSTELKVRNQVVAKKNDLEFKDSTIEYLTYSEKQNFLKENQTHIEANSTSFLSQVKDYKNETVISVLDLFTENKSVSKKTNLKSKTDKRADKNKQMSDDLFFVILIVIAFFIPPLAVYLFEESWTSRVTLNLILTIAAIVLGGIFWGSLGISLMIVPVVHALVVILKG